MHVTSPIIKEKMPLRTSLYRNFMLTYDTLNESLIRGREVKVCKWNVCLVENSSEYVQ